MADVPSDVTVVGIPAKIVRVHGKKDEPVIHEVEEKREYMSINSSRLKRPVTDHLAVEDTYMIQARNKLSQEELSEAKKLINCCQPMMELIP